MRCADTSDDPIHVGRDVLGDDGVIRYCRNESTCAQAGASCSTIPISDENRGVGWRPVAPAPLLRDGVRCTPPDHAACAPTEVCTYCSSFTVCTIARNPPTVFRYYQALVESVNPSGGFIDGGTTGTRPMQSTSDRSLRAAARLC
jgi:hypothetical protein